MLAAAGRGIEMPSQAVHLYLEEGGGFTLTAFLQACRRYPAKKAAGADGRGAKELYSLLKLCAAAFPCAVAAVSASRAVAQGVCFKLHGITALAGGHRLPDHRQHPYAIPHVECMSSPRGS